MKVVNGFKKPKFLSIPVIITTILSVFSIKNNLTLAPSEEVHSLARLSLVSNNNGRGSGDTKGEDARRLFEYYRKYSPHSINIDYGDNKDDFYVHFRGQQDEENPNNLWLNNVRLNQLEIDRYGYEYDENGNKKADSNASLHSIVKWKDIDVDNVYKTDEYRGLPSLSFRFFNQDISKEEVDIISYEQPDKYVLDETETDVSKDWFVWLDKEILNLKLNYALQTYVFNQEAARNETTIKTIIGDTNPDDQQKKRKEAAENNYQHLDEQYKTFAKDYIDTFLDTTNASSAYTDWSKVINSVTVSDSFIKTQDLNKIYNRFKKQTKSLEVFKPHLITKVTSGPTGNWKISLNLKKEDSGEIPTYESRSIPKLTAGTTETLEEKKKNSVLLIMDPDTNSSVKMYDIFNLVSKYSVKNFSLSDSIKKVSSVYSADQSTDEEALRTLSFRHSNEFGMYKTQKWIPVIIVSAFLVGILIYLIVAFKSPGLIVGSSAVASTINVAGAFFALGSQLSLMGLFGFFVGIFYTLFLSYYSLSFLRKIFSIEFLDHSNVWAVFKRGLVLVTDITLPFFILSTFLVFFAPMQFREFGIILSMFALFSFLYVAIGGCLMALGRACANLRGLSHVFGGKLEPVDGYLRACDKAVGRKPFSMIAFSLLLLLLASALILFSFMGMNSFSLFRENFLVIGKNTANLPASLSGQSIPMASSDSKVYLVNVSPGSSISDSVVIPTQAFSDYFTISDLLISVSLSYVLICFYGFVRFKFRGFLLLLLNTCFPFLLFFGILVLSRAPVTSAVFLTFCCFFALSTIYNLSFLSFEAQTKIPWYSPLIAGIKNQFYKQIKWSILWLICVLAIAAVTSFWMVAIYVGAAFLFLHFSSILFNNVFSNLILKFTNRYLLKYNLPADPEKSLDAYDEEVIEGING